MNRKRGPGRPRILGSVLALWCERRGVKYLDLAARLGTTKVRVWTWGRGEIVPNIGWIKRIAEVTKAIEEEQGLARPRGILLSDWTIKIKIAA